MASQVVTQPSGLSGAEVACRIGIPAGIALSFLSAAGFAVGIFTPPRLRPWCVADCTAYPFVDAARFFPRDYLWMLPAVCLAPLFVALAACVHCSIAPARRIFSLLAVCCATVAAALLGLDYVVQVLAVQPGLENHETEGVAFFSQYNPRGLFLAMECLGYLLVAWAGGLLAAALPARGEGVRPLRWTLAGMACLAWLALFLVGVRYRTEMALPLELAEITIVWLALIPTGILMARWFKRCSGRSESGGHQAHG